MSKPIDNFEQIIPLLSFEKEDDFYYLQILQRKKDNPEIGSNSVVIKNYYIKSQDYLKTRREEIIKLCEIFNARASIRLNKRSFEKVAYRAMVNTANVMMNKEFEFVKKVYDRACGEVHNDPNKKWIVDLDEEYQLQSEYLERLKSRINHFQPEGDKIICQIPSKSGLHLITKPFNLQEFTDKKYVIDVHKDNPTNLYIP
jgi:hypothetical protein